VLLSAVQPSMPVPARVSPAYRQPAAAVSPQSPGGLLPLLTRAIRATHDSQHSVRLKTAVAARAAVSSHTP
jgi:hypothetical protein